MKHYVQRPVGRPELQRLRVLARAEEIRFFTDRPACIDARLRPGLVEPGFRNPLAALLTERVQES
jgi:hypothetical protein